MLTCKQACRRVRQIDGESQLEVNETKKKPRKYILSIATTAIAPFIYYKEDCSRACNVLKN